MSEITSIVLCTYNEVEFIEDSIIKIRKNIKNLELVIVDDNSIDGTKEIIQKYSDNDKIKFILRTKLKGLASAFVNGVTKTSGSKIGWIDTNMAYLIEYFPKMSKMLDDNNDIILLSRYVKGGQDKRPIIRSFASKILNVFCKIVFRSRINDFTSGIFLMKRKVLDKVSFIGYGHGDFFIEFLYNAEKNGFRIVETPYIQEKDIDPIKSKSAPNLIRFFYLGFKYIIRVFTTILRRK